jgi:FkbM family methyltransferase
MVQDGLSLPPLCSSPRTAADLAQQEAQVGVPDVSIGDKFARIRELSRSIGPCCTALYVAKLRSLSLLTRLGFCAVKGRQFTLRSSTSRSRVYARYASSDLDVFEQIFVQQTYRCLLDVSKPKLILDCGANVGYSAVYFLNNFPAAHVVAIEPDSGNYSMCQKNLSAYGERVTLLRAGIWTHDAPLIVCRGQYRDGREWAVQVRECQKEETPDVNGRDIGTVLRQTAFRAIDILKIDIEGAERTVFAGSRTWLDQVRNIAIELHDPMCEKVFFTALTGYRYDLSRSGELTLCKNISRIV